MANHDHKGPRERQTAERKAPMKLKRNPQGDENSCHFSEPALQKTRLSRHCTTAAVLGAAVFAIVTLTSPSLQAANILSNPGFETSPALTGWSIHTTETWSINGGNTAGKLYRTGNNSLWTQGLYRNGGAPPPTTPSARSARGRAGSRRRPPSRCSPGRPAPSRRG